MLLIVRDGKPVFDELDTAACQHLFEFRHGAEKLFVFVIIAKAHDALNASTVVPAAIKQHDLACGGQMRHVALKVPLCAFTVVGSGQGSHPANAGVQALRDALDDAAFAGCISAFKQNHNAMAMGHHPVLQLDEFALQSQ